MSFIDKESQIAVNVRLTTSGRKLLASGLLTFDNWAIGDSEIDYTYADNTNFQLSESHILSPMDKNAPIKYYVFPNNTSTTPFTKLNSITPVEIRIHNTAKERGFFLGDTTNGFRLHSESKYVVQNKLNINLNEVSGGTTIKLYQDSGFSLYEEPIVGDYLFVNWINPAYSGTTYSNDIIYSNNPTPQLFYKIQSFTGTVSANTLTVTLDRQLPNYNGSGSGKIAKCLIYPNSDSIYNFYGSGNTTSYWNENTLAFNSNCNVANNDVPVWNMNIVYTEDLAGKQTGYETFANFGSSGYTGFKNFLSLTYDKPSQKSIGIIHYTNNSINNYYGELFYNNSLVLELPTVIWHKSTDNTMGLTLTCNNIAKTSITGSGATDLNTTYYDLIDNSSNVVGKCFINLKTIIIENEELIAAMSYKSNRNWTYPTLINGGNTTGVPTTRPNIFTTSNQKLYVTYLFENNSGYTVNSSYGYKNTLHNQNYIQYKPTLDTNNNLTNNQVPTFSINSGELKYLASTFNGNGLIFNKFKLLYQLVNNNTDRPNPANWLEYDFTSKLNGYPFTNNIIPSTAFDGIIYNIDNNIIGSGITYNLNNYITIPTTSQSNNLQFGDEVVFFGNVKTDIEATVFQTKFLIVLPFNQYNTSINPTWINSTQNVYVNEVAIYDINQTLVAIGKINYPFEKKSSQLRTIELSLDF